MASTYKRLLNPNRNGEQLLIFVIRHGNNMRLDYSSEVKLHQRYWNKDKLVKKSHLEHKALNNLIQSLDAQIQVTVNQIALMSDNDIKSSDVKEKLDLQFCRNKVQKDIERKRKLTFYEFAENYIKDSYTIKKRGTVKTYIQTINRLKEYNIKLDFNDIDMDFYSAFVGYLRADCNILDSTVGKHIKNLKAILNEASEQGYNSKFEYKNRKFKTFRVEADTIYLTKTEIELIDKLDLSIRPGLERVRDLFIIGCNVGLRFSDLSQLDKANIINQESGDYFMVRLQKTEKQVMIPINNAVKKVLQKYEGNVPKAVANQKMNQYLKIICQMAGLDSTIQISNKRRGVLEKVKLKKYEYVTTHTARRSFATNAYLSGVPALAIMKITGHKSESSFMKYIKGSQEENAHTLSKHPFFQ